LDGLQVGATCERDYASGGGGGLECRRKFHNNIPLGLIHWFRKARSVVASRSCLNVGLTYVATQSHIKPNSRRECN
jgi:hypothetical protein